MNLLEQPFLNKTLSCKKKWQSFREGLNKQKKNQCFCWQKKCLINLIIGPNSQSSDYFQSQLQKGKAGNTTKKKRPSKDKIKEQLLHSWIDSEKVESD